MQTFRIIRWGEAKAMPWKNGGGVTHEIAVMPPTASLDDFEWRLSMAEVASDGPFSAFAGIDRTLALMSGAGIVLDFDDGAQTRVDSFEKPANFDGGLGCTGRLIDGPILDLNIMTRRGVVAHVLHRLQPGRAKDVVHGAAAIIGHTGQTHVAGVTPGASPVILGPRDVLLAGPECGPLACHSKGSQDAKAFALQLLRKEQS